MKILFVTNLSEKFSGFHNINDVSKQLDCSGLGLDYPLSLLQELSKHARVDVYSPPLLTYIMPNAMKHPLENFGVAFNKQKTPVPSATNMETLLQCKDYDVVILYAEAMFSYAFNFEKIKQKKVLWFLSSPHQILLPAYTNFFAKNRVDLVIKVVDKAGTTQFGREFKRLGIDAQWLPLSVDGARFRNLNLPKLADVCLLGNLNPAVYPLRVKAVKYILEQNEFRFILNPAYGADFVNAINYSRMFLTCSGVWKFPVMKYFEVLACGTLLLADDPIDAEELGFKANENYASLSDVWVPKVEYPCLPLVEYEWEFREDALRQKLSYYSTHVDDCMKIAEAGEALVRKRHTNEVRAKELFGMLEKL